MEPTFAPPTLYKYFGPVRVSSFETNLLRFSPLSAFNDPFEGRPEIKGIAAPTTIRSGLASHLPKALETEYRNLPPDQRAMMPFRQFKALCISNSKGFIDKHIASVIPTVDKMATLLPDRIDNELGALCLCEDRDNLLMWAHYASSHTGYVVEYYTNNIFFNARRSKSDEYYYLRKVQYQELRPSAYLADLEGPELFLLKSNAWAYENEWRIMKLLSEATKISDDNGQKIHLFKYSPDIIKSITFGARASPDLITKFRSLISENALLSQVKLAQAFPDQSKFQINFRELSV